MAAGTDDGGPLAACDPADPPVLADDCELLADGDVAARRAAGMAALDQEDAKADEHDDDDDENQPLPSGG